MMEEFDRQVRGLVGKGYPDAAAMTLQQFIAQIESLRVCVRGLESSPEQAEERLLLAGRFPRRWPPGSGTLDRRRQTRARLMRGRSAAFLARHGLPRPTCCA